MGCLSPPLIVRCARCFSSVISGGRFSCPGDRRREAGPSLDAVRLSVEEHVTKKSRQSDCVCLKVDGLTDVNAKGVENVLACAPSPCLLGVFRMGLRASSSIHLRNALMTVTPQYLISPTGTTVHG